MRYFRLVQLFSNRVLAHNRLGDRVLGNSNFMAAARAISCRFHWAHSGAIAGDAVPVHLVEGECGRTERNEARVAVGVFQSWECGWSRRRCSRGGGCCCSRHDINIFKSIYHFPNTVIIVISSRSNWRDACGGIFIGEHSADALGGCYSCYWW